MLKKAILLIPLSYNDGTRVPQEILDGIFECYSFCVVGTP